MKTACFSDSYVREKAGEIYPGSYEVEAHTYDANGNRLTLTQNGDTYRYTYGVRNRLESIEKKGLGEDRFKLFTSYTYDANGNTIKRTIYKSDDNIEETMFEYDTMNRVVKTTNHLLEETLYFYDNAGNRFIKEDKDGTTLYLRHGQIAVAMDIEVNRDQTVEKGKINRYVLSGDLIAGRVTTTVGADDSPVIEKSYYHLDHLNSTKMVTDDTGIVEVSYTYRAFGEQLKRLDADDNEVGDEAKYSYGGKELDDVTNLYYFNARYYDATTGRFINVDPIQDGSNWYVYVYNNPMSFVDPTGLETTEIGWLGRILAIASGVIETGLGVASQVVAPGNPLGIYMIAHGAANTAAAIHSTVKYGESDGRDNYATSALGLGVQVITEEISGSKQLGELVGTSVDIGDGFMSMAIPQFPVKGVPLNTLKDVKVVETLNNINKVSAKAGAITTFGGDCLLGGELAVDKIKNGAEGIINKIEWEKASAEQANDPYYQPFPLDNEEK